MRWLLDSPLPLAIVGLLYVAMSAAYWRAGDRGMSLAFIAYALANGGFIWAWLERT